MRKHVSQKAPKQRKRNKILLIVIGVFVIAGIAEYILHPEKYSQTSEEPVNIVQTSEPTEAPTENDQPVGYWQSNPLDEIDLSDEAKRDLYDDLDAAFQKAYETDIAPDASADEADAIEDACIAEIAAKYGVSNEDAENIYLYAALGYLYDVDPDAIKALYGETDSVQIVGTTLTIKVKIDPSLSNKLTVKQNYLNVEDMIQKQNCNLFHKICYWAVADMTNGSESKVVSFDVDKEMIEAIASGSLDTAFYENYLTDLWIHNSLK